MAFSKLYDTHGTAVADIENGATLLIGGTAGANEPVGLLNAVLKQDAAGLTLVIGDAAGPQASKAIRELVASGRVTRIISPYPWHVAADDNGYAGSAPTGVEITTAPQGTLAERLRAAGAGIGGVFVPVGLGTRFAAGKETRSINGVECVLEPPLRADFALLRAANSDHLGNLVYSGAQRAWNAVMATAARITIVEADCIGEPGTINPELVITPGIFVNRIVQHSGVQAS